MRYYSDIVSDIEVVQLDIRGNPVYGVTLIDSFPIEISKMDFTAEGKGEHEIDVKFVYRDFEPNYHTEQKVVKTQEQMDNLMMLRF